MISSMTGFGLSSSIDVGAEVYVEIKGVNHRFLEISIKPNDLDNELDEYFRKKYCGIIETIEERDARGGFKDLPGFPED